MFDSREQYQDGLQEEKFLLRQSQKLLTKPLKDQSPKDHRAVGQKKLLILISLSSKLTLNLNDDRKESEFKSNLVERFKVVSFSEQTSG